MLFKVVSDVKRRISQIPGPQPEEQGFPPELTRWSDFSSPLPPISFGSYKKFYARYENEKQESPPIPILSQSPAPSPSREIPPRSTLFSLTFIPPSKHHCLTIIPETSMETMNTDKACLPARKSLRRRRRTLLRTPSIERDFALHGRSFSAFMPPSPVDSEYSAATYSSDTIGSRTSDSSDSHSMESDSNTSEFPYPVTPSTSIPDVDHHDPRLRLKIATDAIHNFEGHRGSIAESFSTAKSDLGDV